MWVEMEVHGREWVCVVTFKAWQMIVRDCSRVWNMCAG